MARTLTDWLHTFTPEQTAELLRTRPDAVAPPSPRDLRELAERLEIFGSVAAVVYSLPQPAVEVIEVLQLLGPAEGTRETLASWLGVAPADPDLNTTLDRLSALALVWPERTAPQAADTGLRMAGPLYQTFPHPLRLGPPAAELIQSYSAEALRSIAGRLGLAASGRKDAVAAGIVRFLTDPDQVRALVAKADPETRSALEQLATEDPPEVSYRDYYTYQVYQPDPRLRWARERALVILLPPGLPQLPREVAVALRGPDWHAPFTPHRPDPPTTAINAEAVRLEAAAAGTAAVEQTTALLETVAANGVALLKAGGVGVKELRRLARAAGTDESTVRLWLELAFETGLVAVAADGDSAAVLLPTADYDQWAASEPAAKLATLLEHWLPMSTSPLRPPEERSGKPAAALLRDYSGQLAVVARRHIVEYVASLPAGSAVTDLTALTGALAWHSPLILGTHPDAEPFISAAWREAHLLGVLAHGAITPLGRALRDPSSLTEACQALLPAATGEAIFQADLTALVPGNPQADLARLLDAAARRETRGGAVTWRFDSDSVRRALDHGYQPDQLVEQLRERAVGNAIPQPLAYLIADVGRRHGSVKVRPAACVLRADDHALLAEVAKHRATRSLGLSVVAPGVLSSQQPVSETLAVLRAAGYAPVAESEQGVPTLERVTTRRAVTGRAGRGARRTPREGSRFGRPESPGYASEDPNEDTGDPAEPIDPADPADPADAAGAESDQSAGGDPHAQLLAYAQDLHAASPPQRRRSADEPPHLPGQRGSSSPSAVLTGPSPTDLSGEPELSRPEPARTEPSGAELDRAEPSRAELDRAELDEGDEGSDELELLEEFASHLAPGELRLLEHAVTTGTPIKIEYTSGTGGRTQRVIEPIELEGARLVAWCQLRDDEREFLLFRINSVSPASPSSLP